MKIVTVRRISQGLFFAMFLWLGFVSSVGQELWQMRKWPVNWFLQLDPLAAVGTMLTTHTLYRSLLWALATVVLTIILGRFFCGWVCPFGSLHQFVGYLAHRKKTLGEKIELNRYRKAQGIKYFVLAFLLAGMAIWPMGVSLQSGLLDPIPLITRSFNLAVMPMLDKPVGFVSAGQRFYEGAWLIFAIFAAAVLLNFVVPRFYCRFVCPLGAMFGVLGRFAIWRIGKKADKCPDCRICERGCEGGCDPARKIKIAECVLCFNCREDCRHELVVYQAAKSKAGEVTGANISRRGFMLSVAGGILAVPAVRLSGKLAGNWDNFVRPPGALREDEFLKRCIKCGQCVRVCPTNVIQLNSAAGGLEGLWTPILNNRIGSSGCQLNCVACGAICPTGAIRPISLDEKHGKGEFADAGPIRLGTAFFDRDRCLPWSMDKPCIVCQENCPVSPKAIFTREYYSTVRGGELTVGKVAGNTIETVEGGLSAGKFATGDYFCVTGKDKLWKISANTENSVIIAAEETFEQPASGSKIEIQVRLQRPFVDIEKCIGCGICEHECPVSGKKAVRVSAEGQSRDNNRGLYIQV